MEKEEKEKLTETLPFRVTAEMRQRLARQAREQERSLNWLIRRYVKEGLERDERRGK